MPRHLRLVTSLLAVAALGAAAACGGDDSAFDVSDVDAEEVLAQSADRMEALTSFGFDIDHENGSTAIVGGIQMVSATGAVQGTDRMRLEVEARFGNTNIETAIVILPGEGYLQNPITGRWQRQDGMDMTEFFDPAQGVTALMRGATGAEVLRGETIDGVDAYVIEATLDSGELGVFVSNAPPGQAVTTRVWVGVEDLLVRRVEAHGPIASGDADNIVRRLTLRDFDAAVEITAPR